MRDFSWQARAWHSARLLFAAFCIECALLSGCHRHDEEFAQVRIINAVSDADSIEVGLPGEHRRLRLGYRTGQPYTAVPAGSYELTLSADLAARGIRVLPASPLTISANRHYTAVAMGIADSDSHASLHLFEETPSIYPLNTGQTLVRAVDACPDAASVDVLLNDLAAFKNLHYGQISSAIAVPSMCYACLAKTAGDRYTPLNLPKPVVLHGGKVCLLVIEGRVRDGSVSIDAYED